MIPAMRREKGLSAPLIVHRRKNWLTIHKTSKATQPCLHESGAVSDQFAQRRNQVNRISQSA
jgi:hypothetical protein